MGHRYPTLLALILEVTGVKITEHGKLTNKQASDVIKRYIEMANTAK